MKITEIERERIKVPEGTQELCPNLAEESLTVLGYSILKDTGNAAGLSKLQQVLAEHEIEVLRAKQVDLYKAEQWERRQRELFDEHLKGGKEHLLDPAGKYWSSWPTTAAWTEVEISQYKEAIPLHVLDKAVQIKKALPDAEIIIEHLTESQDPFLVVKHGGKKVYVDVWEEPRFEATL
jgi:hypothetical protein